MRSDTDGRRTPGVVRMQSFTTGPSVKAFLFVNNNCDIRNDAYVAAAECNDGALGEFCSRTSLDFISDNLAVDIHFLTENQ